MFFDMIHRKTYEFMCFLTWHIEKHMDLCVFWHDIWKNLWIYRFFDMIYRKHIFYMAFCIYFFIFLFAFLYFLYIFMILLFCYFHDFVFFHTECCLIYSVNRIVDYQTATLACLRVIVCVCVYISDDIDSRHIFNRM